MTTESMVWPRLSSVFSFSGLSASPSAKSYEKSDSSPSAIPSMALA